MTFGKIIQRIHLWAGLLIGIQVIFWMTSGVVMSWFHIDLVRGERSAFSAPALELEAKGYASPGGVIAQMDGATTVSLRHFLGRPVYEAEGVNESALFDASTGERISPVEEKAAREVANADYVGAGKITQLNLMTDAPHEYRGKQPVWRADFDDGLHTRLYISPETGRVISRRNDVWRIFDFFWMLHIMDYGDRTNINSLLLRAFAAAGLLFAFSGLVLVVMKKGRNQIARDLLFITGQRKRSS
jgi:uncharacterized iron-regulated membrane protein